MLLGVLVVSSAALLIREAQATGAGGVAIASGRLGIAVACLVPLVAWKAGRGAAARPLALTLRDVGIAVGAGARSWFQILRIAHQSGTARVDHRDIFSRPLCNLSKPLSGHGQAFTS
ncbi:MAG: hypothetical protein EBT08_23315, partial [Betaproteobacteria bacterium]|nr:hypothetical protein [Betaproteobacteria bacterium]